MGFQNVGISTLFKVQHVVFHIGVLAIVIIGLMKYPGKSETTMHGPYHAKMRAGSWVALESILLLISLCALTYDLIVSCAPNPPGFLTWLPFHGGIVQRPVEWNFFYYAFMTNWVVYGSMIGCHMPRLFWAKETKYGWQYALILAISFSFINAISYFIASFYPLSIPEAYKSQFVTAPPPTDVPDEGEIQEGSQQSLTMSANPASQEINSIGSGSGPKAKK